jgi:hypothetical protein
MDERETGGPALIMLSALASVIALAIILAALAYSFVHALDGGDTERPAQAQAAPRATPGPSPTPFVFVMPPGPREPSAFYVFIMCDGETVETAIYSGIIYADWVSLYQTADRALIMDLLEGRPTILPPQSKIFSSRCAERLFANQG